MSVVSCVIVGLTPLDTYYRAQQKLVVAGSIAKALRAEALRLTVACQRPILAIDERPDQVDILARNPQNKELEWGSCGLDVERQGGCRLAVHCFECPLLVPWVSKRYNYVVERDEYLGLAEKAENMRDRENFLTTLIWLSRILYLLTDVKRRK